MDQAGPSRRAVLAGAGALALAACSGGNRRESPEPDPDPPITALAVAGVRRLAALYDVVGRAHPSLAPELAPLAAETASHLAALQPPPAGSGSASPPGPSPSPTPALTAPPTVAGARAALAAAERHEADLRVTQLARASSGLARLLAAIGASEATHATLLGRPA
jgi:hypothetical protein